MRYGARWGDNPLSSSSLRDQPVDPHLASLLLDVMMKCAEQIYSAGSTEPPSIEELTHFIQSPPLDQHIPEEIRALVINQQASDFQELYNAAKEVFI